ncbi:hypothetical protein TCAL_16757 [Tigriopus californicus]|uniref:Uncharacterized protein n=1 Tax=Tigriopus californicus TaxID=6832 RepID=A0A553PTW5_TIGCA|nr:hypothetical protein TCAL_16757 [Tigriopus californicus]
MNCILSVAVEEVLHDHFLMVCQTELDKSHLEEMDLNKADQHDYQTTKDLVHDWIEAATGGGNEDEELEANRVLQSHPSFDPVFMKV